MAQEPLVETVEIGGKRYPAAALVGSGGAPAAPLPAGVTLTDASITSATGASQQLVAANAARQVLNVSNPSATSWWINEAGGTAAANNQGSFELAPGARWTPRPAPINAVTGVGTAASKLTITVG